MIIVVADDFTGAAELAGISLQFGLIVQLFTNDVTACNADVAISFNRYSFFEFKRCNY